MMSRMFSETISNSTLFSICKEIDAIDDNDTSVVFEPQYHGGSTMLKLFDMRPQWPHNSDEKCWSYQSES